MAFKINSIGFIVLVLCTVTLAKISHSSNVLWFPSPEEDGTFIPALLEPRPGRQQRNESDIHFYLYTKTNPTTSDELFVGDVEALQRSNFKHGATIKMLAHGFGGNERSGFPWRVRGEFINLNEEVNVILVDWKILAESPFYLEAAANTKIVGQKSAELLEFLVEQGVAQRNRMHLIGFSLGAHVSAITGSSMLANVSRLTGLDPARPLFDIADDADRIDPSDADFVDVIHTAGLTLAFLNPRGQADFFPNGGAVQPGCGVDLTGSCAHSRAVSYFEESITNPLGFRGPKCDSWANYDSGLCSNNPLGIMGHATPSIAQGSYYLRTNEESPYAQG